MNPTVRSALTAVAAFVVFTWAVAATRHDPIAGLQTGLMMGLGVFVAHWFAARGFSRNATSDSAADVARNPHCPSKG